MHSTGPEEFVIAHTGLASPTEDIIAEFYIGAIYSGALIEVTSEGLVSNRSGVVLKSIIGIVRQGSAAVTEGVVTLLHRTYTVSGSPAPGTPPAHTIGPNGNNQLLKLTFDANGTTGSEFRHHVKVYGAKTITKVY